jgi:hypothetical protein
MITFYWKAKQRDRQCHSKRSSFDRTHDNNDDGAMTKRKEEAACDGYPIKCEQTSGSIVDGTLNVECMVRRGSGDLDLSRYFHLGQYLM